MSGADPSLEAALVTLRTRVDGHFDAAHARSPTSFACAPGCESCCHQQLSVFEVEAARIRRALSALEDRDPGLRQRVREQAAVLDDPRCALLVEGRCSIYAERPLICRSHGLPIAVPTPDDPEVLEVDHCPLNFTEAPPPRASILVLDALNRPLAVLAELAAPGQPRVPLRELAAATAADPGSPPG